jgi:hypothetical protein
MSYAPKSSSSAFAEKPVDSGRVFKLVGRAPDEDAPASENKDAPLAVKKIKTGADILDEDFKWIEQNIFTTKPIVEGKESSLPDKQQGFNVDLMSNEDIMKFNENQTWNQRVTNGRSFYGAWPGQAAWYSGDQSEMSFNFAQRNLSMRVSDMINNTRSGDNAMFIGFDKNDFWEYGGISKERKDNHALIQSIAITGCNTKNLPHDVSLGFWTQAENGEMRQWRKPKAQRSFGTYGSIDGTVLEPGMEFRSLSDPVIFETSQEQLCSPWISRFLQFNFEKFLAETVNGFQHKSKHPDFIRIKGPEDEKTARFTELQWFLFTFFRALQWETRAKLDELKATDPSQLALIGDSVVQKRYTPGAKADDKPIGTEFLISKAAMENVVKQCREKVRAATILANFDRVGITLNFIGDTTFAEQLQGRMEAMKKVGRDALERDGFVAPFSVNIKVKYIALPDGYPVLETQTRQNLGKDVTVKPIKEAKPMPAVRPLNGTSGKHAYGTNSFRNSMSLHQRKT